MKNRSAVTRHHEQGWVSDWKDASNESGSTIDSKSLESIGGGALGSELDEAFRRGREYCNRGYSLDASKKAIKKKNQTYKVEFVRGWKWQNSRKKPADRKRKGVL